jgi:RNA polymerase sigma factor (sigma-70 family)
MRIFQEEERTMQSDWDAGKQEDVLGVLASLLQDKANKHGEHARGLLVSDLVEAGRAAAIDFFENNTGCRQTKRFLQRLHTAIDEGMLTAIHSDERTKHLPHGTHQQALNDFHAGNYEAVVTALQPLLEQKIAHFAALTHDPDFFRDDLRSIAISTIFDVLTKRIGRESSKVWPLATSIHNELNRILQNATRELTQPQELAAEPVADTAEEPVQERRVYVKDFRRAVRAVAMNGRYRDVLRMRIVSERTLDDIGIAIGVTRERVRQMEMRALRILRKARTPTHEEIRIMLETAEDNGEEIERPKQRNPFAEFENGFAI